VGGPWPDFLVAVGAVVRLTFHITNPKFCSSPRNAASGKKYSDEFKFKFQTRVK
jgi:hypothetical protein